MPDDKTRRGRDTGFVAGCALSLAVLAAGGLALWLKRAELAAVGLGDWGSFIGGIASALAFVWVVLAYRQQNRELALQLEEFAESVAAQQRQAAASEEAIKQVDLARRERRPTFRPSTVDWRQREWRVRLLVTGGPAIGVTLSAAVPDVLARINDAPQRADLGQAIVIDVLSLPLDPHGHPDEGRARSLPDEILFTLRFLDETGQEFAQHVRLAPGRNLVECGPADPLGFALV